MSSLTEIVSLPSPITICDIGAALAEQPVYGALVATGAARIVGFEPAPAECDRLNATYGAPHRFYPHFIADGRPHTFHETNYTMTGSLFEPNNELNGCFTNLAELLQPVAQHPVETTRLDDVDGLDDIDFLKIDVQGAELMTFQNAPRLLAKTLVIQTEVLFVMHYKDQPLFAEVDQELRAKGFQFHTFEGFGSRAFKPLLNGHKSRGFRQIIWSDAVYVRDWMKLDAIPDDKMLKYAVIANDILQSPDLAHFVLKALDKRRGSDWAPRYRALLNVKSHKPAVPP